MAIAVANNVQNSFFQELARAKSKALLLDYDGTLAPFRAERQSAKPYPGVAELLTLIMNRTSTKVVFISGRPATELRSLVPIVPSPEIWGSHGAERLRPDGSCEIVDIPLTATELLAGVDHTLEAEGLKHLLEGKTGAIAVHWRGLSDSRVRYIRAAVLRVWDGLQPQAAMILSEFNGGIEFRLRLRNKGDAVLHVLRELPESTAIAYLGDDQTDEDAFKALKGHGLSVLVRDRFRTTAADLWIQAPLGVLEFLNRWLISCSAEVK